MQFNNLGGKLDFRCSQHSLRSNGLWSSHVCINIFLPRFQVHICQQHATNTDVYIVVVVKLFGKLDGQYRAFPFWLHLWMRHCITPLGNDKTDLNYTQTNLFEAGWKHKRTVPYLVTTWFFLMLHTPSFRTIFYNYRSVCTFVENESNQLP